MDSTSSPDALFVVGLVNLAFGAWLLIRARRLRARGVQVPGVVTGLVRSRNNDSPTSRPIFRFTTLEGHELEVTSDMGEGRPPQPGDRVTILYDPQKPRYAVIATSGQRGLILGWIVTVLGLLCVLGGLNII